MANLKWRDALNHPNRTVRKLLREMLTLQREMLYQEKALLPGAIYKEHVAGARNRLHDVALRRHDIRELQRELAFGRSVVAWSRRALRHGDRYRGYPLA